MEQSLKMRKNKGITMIALVITIIVLLILAGVSIAMLSGKNGVLTRAQEAKEATEIAQIEEEVVIKWNEVQLDNIENPVSNNNELAQILQDKLRLADENATVSYRSGSETFEVNYKGHEMELQANGQISNNRTTAKNNIIIAYDKVKSTSSDKAEQAAALQEELRKTDPTATVTYNQTTNNIEIIYNGYKEEIDGNGNVNITEPAEKAKLTITSQPKSIEVYENGEASFAVAVDTNGTATYQWYKNSKNTTTGATPISGATTNTYTISNATLEDNNTYYYCEVIATLNDTEKTEQTTIAKLSIYVSAEAKSENTVTEAWAEIKDDDTLSNQGKAAALQEELRKTDSSATVTYNEETGDFEVKYNDHEQIIDSTGRSKSTERKTEAETNITEAWANIKDDSTKTPQQKAAALETELKKTDSTATVTYNELTGDYEINYNGYKETIDSEGNAKSSASKTIAEENITNAWAEIKDDNTLSSEEKAAKLEAKLKKTDTTATVTYNSETDTYEITYNGYKETIDDEGNAKSSESKAIAENKINDTWNSVKNDDTLTPEQKAEKLQEELQKTDSTATVTYDLETGNTTVTYNGYTETIARDGNIKTPEEKETAENTVKDAWAEIKDDDTKTPQQKAAALEEELQKTDSDATVTYNTETSEYEIDYKGYKEIVDEEGNVKSTEAPSATVTQQPNNIELFEGSTGNITCKATIIGEATYQWYKNGTESNQGGIAIEGATSNTLNITNASLADDGKYVYCDIVTTLNGKSVKTTTNTASLTIISKITKNNIQITEDQSAIEGDNVTLTATINGRGDISRQWYKVGAEGQGAAISGATGTTYELQNTTTENSGDYYYIVTQKVGTEENQVTSDQTKVTITSKVSIIANPTDEDTIETHTATFEVVASGQGRLSYQWYSYKGTGNEIEAPQTPIEGATAIDGATSATYETDGVKEEDNNTYYYCVVTQDYGNTKGVTATSTAAKLTVLIPEMTASNDEVTAYVGGSERTVTLGGTNVGDFEITEGTNANNYEDEYIIATIEGSLLTIAPKAVGNSSVTIKETNAGRTKTINVEVLATTILANNQNPLNITTHVGAEDTYITLSGTNVGTFSIDNIAQNNNYVTASITGGTITLGALGATPENSDVIITAKEANGNQTVEINVKVNQAIPSLELSSEEGRVDFDSTTSFTAIVACTPAVDGTWTVTSSDKDVVEITTGNGEEAKDSVGTTITYKGLAATTTPVTITVLFTPSDTTNYTSAMKTYTVTAVNKIDATNPTLTSYTGNYDGEAHSIGVNPEEATSLGGTEIQYREGENGTWSATKPTRTEYGTTTVYVKVIGDANHNDTEAISATITIEEGAMTYESGNYSGVYDGNAHTITLNITEPTGTTIYYSTETELTTNNYETAGTTNKPEITNVDDSCTVYWYIKSNAENYKDEKGSNTITITKAEATTPSLTAYEGAYDANSHGITVAPEEAASLGGTEIQYREGADGEWSAISPTRTNAGTTTVYVKVIGDANHNNTDEISTTITINKAQPTVTLSPDNGEVNYLGTATFTATPTSTPAINGTWSVESNNTANVSITDGNNSSATNETETTITYRGNVATENETTITVTFVPSDATNYEEAEATYTVAKVNKINATNPTVENYEGAYNGNAQKVGIKIDGTSIDDLTPAQIQASLGGTIEYSTDEGAEKTWSTTAPTETNYGTTTVYVRVQGDDNHHTTTPVSGTITINKADITPTVSINGYTYGGIESAPQVNGNSGEGEVQYYYSTSNTNTGGTNWSDVTSSTSLNAGTYYIYATVGETTNYNTATTEPVEFEVAKATPTVTLSETTGEVNYNAEKSFTAVATSTPAINGTWEVISSSTANVGITSGDEATATNGAGSIITYKGLAATENETTISVTFKPSDETNYEEVTEEYTVTAVNKIDATNPTLTSYTGNYDGQAHTIGVSTTDTATLGGALQYRTSEDEEETWSDWTNWTDTTYPTRTNYGTTNIEARVEGDANHNSTTTVATASISIGTRTLGIENGNTEKTYDGEASAIKLIVKDVSGNELYNAEKILSEEKTAAEYTDVTVYYSETALTDSNYTSGSITVPTRTDVGTTSTYWYIKSNNSNYEDRLSETANTIKINQKSISGNDITITLGETSYTYDGTEKSPSVTVKDTTRNTNLTADTDYTLSYTNSATTDSDKIKVNAGTVTITITGTGNYSESTTKTYTIAKANAVAPQLTSKTYTWDGEQKTVEVSGGSGGTIYYKWDNGEWKTTLGTASVVGSWTIYAKTVGDENHNDSAQTSATLTINKADQTWKITSSLTIVAGNTGTITVTGTGYGTRSSSIPSAQQTYATVSDLTVTAKAAGTATVTVTYPGDEHYNSRSQTCTVTVQAALYEVSSVASGKQKYHTALKSAVDAAATTGTPTITFKGNTTETGNVTISKTLTIDAGSYTRTSNDQIKITAGTVTLTGNGGGTNATSNGGTATFYVQNSATFKTQGTNPVIKSDGRAVQLAGSSNASLESGFVMSLRAIAFGINTSGTCEIKRKHACFNLLSGSSYDKRLGIPDGTIDNWR